MSIKAHSTRILSVIYFSDDYTHPHTPQHIPNPHSQETERFYIDRNDDHHSHNGYFGVYNSGIFKTKATYR